MPIIREGNLTFHFPDGWQATKFDDWSFYRNQFQKVCGGAKAIDMLALAPDRIVWLIEVKDYRQYPRTKAIDLADEIACKIRNSLAALFAAHINANDVYEKDLAGNALKAKRIRVVLHLEQQPTKLSKVFPNPIGPAQVKQKLKQLLKAIDAHPLVLEMSRMGNAAWTVN